MVEVTVVMLLILPPAGAVLSREFLKLLVKHTPFLSGIILSVVAYMLE